MTFCFSEKCCSKCVESKTSTEFELSWWRHQMETFSVLLALCEGNPVVTGGFFSQWPVTGALMFSLICAWTNGWENTRYTGDLRRLRALYDGTVMWWQYYLRNGWVDRISVKKRSQYAIDCRLCYKTAANALVPSLQRECHFDEISSLAAPQVLI